MPSKEAQILGFYDKFCNCTEERNNNKLTFYSMHIVAFKENNWFFIIKNYSQLERKEGLSIIAKMRGKLYFNVEWKQEFNL